MTNPLGRKETYMRFGGVPITDELLQAAQTGKLVIFAGAGVSMSPPVKLPNFDDLVDQIKDRVDPGNYLRLRKSDAETPEQYLGYLNRQNKNVKKACSNLIDPGGSFDELHAKIMGLFIGENPVRIVTTNFDDCFENALDKADRTYKRYIAPALPLGTNVDGLVHLHGVYDEINSMVLTAEDYGSAYVSDGWSSRFLVKLFTSYTVLFVGYSCSDTPVDYLTRSISSEIAGRSYVLCKEDDVDNWSTRGVKPIVFDDYDALPTIFGELASYLGSSITDKAIHLREICHSKDRSQDDEEFIVSLLNCSDTAERQTYIDEFCKSAHSIQDLYVLKKYGFDNFLTSYNPTTTELELLDWAIGEFAISEKEAFQEFCVSSIHILSPSFFSLLFWHLYRSDTLDSVIGSWLPWLDSAGYLAQKLCEPYLVGIAENTESEAILLAVIRILLRVYASRPESSLANTLLEATTVASSDSLVERLLTKVSTKSGTIGHDVFEFCFAQLEKAYSITTNHWTASSSFDAISFRRVSIAPHEQDDFHSGAESVLIDFARDSINESFCAEAYSRCMSSNCGLLVRLGLWIKCEYSCTGDDLTLVQTKGLLYDPDYQHETFALIKKAYPLATSTEKERFIGYIKSRIKEGDRTSDYECYNLCNWLLEDYADQDLESLQSEIISRNPEFEPREYLDLPYYATSSFEDPSARLHIPVNEFTNERMLALINDTNPSLTSFDRYNFVATPARDFPSKAIDNLNALLDGEESSPSEITLMNYLVESIEWGIVDVQRDELVSSIIRTLSDARTCVAAINAICTQTIKVNGAFSFDELAAILKSALPHFNKLLASEPPVHQRNGHDWVTEAINHPAGEFIALLAQAARETNMPDNAHRRELESCFAQVCERLNGDSLGAKYAISMLFHSLNELYELCPNCFEEKLFYALEAGNWAFSPAWEGLSYVRGLTRTAWNATRGSWPDLLCNQEQIKDTYLRKLIELYVWCIISHAEPNEKIHLLVSCMTSSKIALQAACHHLYLWMKSLEANEQLDAWKDWLSVSFGQISDMGGQATEGLAEFYCLCLRHFPCLRQEIAQATPRDCTDVRGPCFNLHDGDLSSIAGDQSLSAYDKALLLSFLLDHQKGYFYEEDAQEALNQIRLTDFDPLVLRNFKDAFTRKGLLDELKQWASGKLEDAEHGIPIHAASS